MRIDVIRHGVTANNRAGRFNLEDEPLLRAEVRRLRTISLPPARYERVYVSPLRRCVETADALGLTEYVVDPRLAERRFGVFGGLTAAQCKTHYREDFDAFSRFDGEFAPHDGESRADHFSRTWAWLQDVSTTDDAHLLAIAHGGVVDFLYRLAIDHPVHGGDRIYSGDNAAMSSFVVDGPRISLLRFSHPLIA